MSQQSEASYTPDVSAAADQLGASHVSPAEVPLDTHIIEVWEEVEDPHGMGRPSTTVTLDLIGAGGDAYFSATLNDHYYSDYKTLEASTLHVDERLNGKGYGERLVRALAVVGVEQSCEDIEVEFDHPASLIHFLRIFGHERVHYYKEDLGNRKEIHYTDDEAIARINEARERAKRPIGDKMLVKLSDTNGIKAWVDLGGLDVSGWERTVKVDAADAPWNQED